METIYDVMKDRLQVTETTLMVTVLSGPRQGDKTVYAEDGSVLYGTPIEGFTVDKAKLNSLCMVGEIECFVQPVENDPSVLVLGAGHVSRAITDLLLFIGCRVTVVDDRPEYVVPEFFDERVTRKCLPLENFKNDLPLDEYNGFIIVTRAHEYDNICLEQLRGYLPTYMGVMGSQKRIHYAFEVLREQGWTQEELDMVYAPIGLDLGAQTPEEIALSIVSEYLAVVRGKQGGSLRKGRVSHES
ncbi:XdhC family protein [Veillonella sp.]|uniref:XdhC family protein n=1 Tax=Veillonella sp. TaxID=1926307 RepID=UPI00290E1110|nr:XdhC family protein [Veillonella sp.]MDU5495210.1 XdhC family protein [Veillonella sp.]